MKGLFSLDSKFGRMLHKVGQCVQLSIFWLLCSLPVVTSGAASCALYATSRKVLRDEEGKLFDTYWKSFKDCLKQGSLVGVVTLAFCALVIYCSLLMLHLDLLSGFIGNVMKFIYYGIVVVLLVWVHYIYAYIARFNDSMKTILRNTIFMLLMHSIPTLKLAGQLVLVCLLLYYLDLMRFLPTLVLLLPCAYAMMTVKPIESVFEIYKPTEGQSGEGQ